MLQMLQYALLQYNVCSLGLRYQYRICVAWVRWDGHLDEFSDHCCARQAFVRSVGSLQSMYGRECGM
jgi:hypothetical protein